MFQMVDWFNNLESGIKIWSAILALLLCLGIVRQLLLCIRYWITDLHKVRKFLQQSSSYVDGLFSGTDNNPQAQYIIRKYHSIGLLFGKDRVILPECDMANSIIFNNVRTRKEYDDIIRQLATTYLEWDEKRRNAKWLMLIQLLIPVVFWLFRGIECIILLFAYFLQELGFKKINTNGIAIKILSTLFTVATGLASLFAYLNINIFS